MSSVGVFLVLGLTGFGVGVSGIVRNSVLAKTISESDLTARLSANSAVAESRLTSAPDPITVNSGGPEENEQADGENTEIETQIRQVEAGMIAANIPTMWPHEGKINNEFGFRRNPFGGRAYEFHPGMDIDGERGEEVYAPSNGTVIKAAYTGGYGNMLEIDHGNGITTRYGHLSKIEVSVGDTIAKGQAVAQIGSTGRSTGPHLHYELRLNDKSINPRHVLPPESPELGVK